MPGSEKKRASCHPIDGELANKGFGIVKALNVKRRVVCLVRQQMVFVPKTDIKVCGPISGTIRAQSQPLRFKFFRQTEE
jgi:hypothetical protein